MNQKLPIKIKRLLKKNGFSNILNFSKFKIGRNNQVWKIVNNNGSCIVKIYPPFKKKYNLRLNSEFKFLKILNSRNILGIPRAIDKDKKNNIALYSYIQGKKVNKIKNNYICQAINFIKKINKLKRIKSFKNFYYASDSCLSIKSHIFCVQKRIDKLKNLKVKSDLEVETSKFLKKEIFPIWDQKKVEIINSFKGKSIARKFDKFELIISPSDFGFHNMIENNNKIFFLDFEYAGWDDPAKLICDFICQPDYNLKDQYCESFMQKIASISPRQEEVLYRVKNLLLLHRIKWCCVLLNEFVKENNFARQHAIVLSQEVLKKQLKKSKGYFKKYFN